eukprot:snap_masked-scaffold_25-processed-gene-1.8-mRNA-1 protein AED:1.00 eAED:1.00 QI:0/0/0/0/1/1/2/0/96
MVILSSRFQGGRIILMGVVCFPRVMAGEGGECSYCSSVASKCSRSEFMFSTRIRFCGKRMFMSPSLRMLAFFVCSSDRAGLGWGRVLCFWIVCSRL